jgi:hypothetical protein
MRGSIAAVNRFFDLAYWRCCTFVAAGLRFFVCRVEQLADYLGIELVCSRIDDVNAIAAGVFGRVARGIGESEQGIRIGNSARWRDSDTQAN